MISASIEPPSVQGRASELLRQAAVPNTLGAEPFLAWCFGWNFERKNSWNVPRQLLETQLQSAAQSWQQGA